MRSLRTFIRYCCTWSGKILESRTKTILYVVSYNSDNFCEHYHTFEITSVDLSIFGLLWHLLLNCVQSHFKFWKEMMILLHFLLTLLLVSPLNSSFIVLIESFAACETNKKFPFQVSNLSAYNRRGKSYASAHLLITETIKGPIEQEVLLERCDMQKTKCMSAPTIYSPDQCLRLNESYFASNFFGKMEPPIVNCPFKPVGIPI